MKHFLRERAHIHANGEEEQRERESQAGSTLSLQPYTGLDPTTLGSWPEWKLRVRHSTDWATPAPLYTHFLLQFSQQPEGNILIIPFYRCGNKGTVRLSRTQSPTCTESPLKRLDYISQGPIHRFSVLQAISAHHASMELRLANGHSSYLTSWGSAKGTDPQGVRGTGFSIWNLLKVATWSSN